MLERIVQRGTLVTVATLIVCVLGIVAAFRIPVQMIPDLEVRTITVFTRWPGATPQDIEKEIIIEQEEYLRSISASNGSSHAHPAAKRGSSWNFPTISTSTKPSSASTTR